MLTWIRVKRSDHVVLLVPKVWIRLPEWGGWRKKNLMWNTRQEWAILFLHWFKVAVFYLFCSLASDCLYTVAINHTIISVSNKKTSSCDPPCYKQLLEVSFKSHSRCVFLPSWCIKEHQGTISNSQSATLVISIKSGHNVFSMRHLDTADFFSHDSEYNSFHLVHRMASHTLRRKRYDGLCYHS